LKLSGSSSVVSSVWRLCIGRYFLIERSTDGIDFETVSAQIQGVGNSDYSSRYTWTDPPPAAGINYYRLK